MNKPHPVIVRQPATWATALGMVLFALAGPALAVATDPATSQPTTNQGPGEPATNAPAATGPASTKPATTQPVLTASCVPDPNSFRVFDVPSDDGTGIFVEWAKPAEEPKGLTYVVQVARSKADFQAGRFETRDISPSPKILASTKPNYFGYSEETKGLYYTVITPADLFEPTQPGPLTERRLRDFAKQDVLTPDQLARALAVMAALQKERLAKHPATSQGTATAPAQATAELTPAEKADREWFASLEAHLTKLDADAVDAETAKVNAAPYFFRLAVKLGDQTLHVARDGEPVVVQAAAEPNLFKRGRLNNLILSLIFSAIALTFIEIAKQRPGLFIRKIAGLEAIDEAIGRATEMDRPVFFVHGLLSVDNVATIAAVNILSHIARRTAEHDSRLRVTNIDPIVTAVSQEVVQQAYTEAGRPDAYNPDDVSLVAYDQFSYTAAVAGTIIREQPGAIFYLGSFAAESLLLAETGASTGAIQVSGTEQYTQLPFFITTCDYTLIGEELFAASAYLSREPRLLGGLRGQDVGKAFIMITLVLGTILLTAAVAMKWDPDWVGWLRRLLEASMN